MMMHMVHSDPSAEFMVLLKTQHLLRCSEEGAHAWCTWRTRSITWCTWCMLKSVLHALHYERSMAFARCT